MTCTVTADSGMTAAAIQDPEDDGRGKQYWTTVDDRLKAAGVTRGQVQVIWIKQADAGPTQEVSSATRTAK